jgi:hypothetical protein
MKVYLSVFLLFFSIQTYSQVNDATLAPLLETPRYYYAIKTNQEINIDGKDTESAWTKAHWSETFVGIEGKTNHEATYKTRYKMLWDDNYLYVYVKIEEPHIWAKLKAHDQIIFQDNALEIFIDTDSGTHDYIEFQINAFAAVWDLIMTKPYRNGGESISTWDVKGLKKAVWIDGTINNPTDKDNLWSVELAFPVNALKFGSRKTSLTNTTWRMNFSRVQHEMEVKGNDYEYKKDKQGRSLGPAYYVWTPQGLVNLHYPERYGYVKFVENSSTPPTTEEMNSARIIRELWKYYYLEQEFKNRNKKYALSITELKKDFPQVTLQDFPDLQLSGTPYQFYIQIEDRTSKQIFTIDHEGKQNQHSHETIK